MKKLLSTLLILAALTIGNLWAGEIRQNVSDAAFVAKAEQSQEEIFKFDLPEIPAGSRIDFAGLILHIQRDSARDNYLFLKLVPVTSDWTPASLAGGQLLSVDDNSPSYAVGDISMGDRIDLDITALVTDWTTDKKTNRGFLLKTGIPEDETNFSAKSIAGAKAELVIYFTEPEKK